MPATGSDTARSIACSVSAGADRRLRGDVLEDEGAGPPGLSRADPGDSLDRDREQQRADGQDEPGLPETEVDPDHVQ